MTTSCTSSDTITLKITNETDSIWCGSQSVAFAENLGFEGKTLWEINISVRELVTNIIKYAGTGVMILTKLTEPNIGIEITAKDNGPGISDVDSAMIDGYSEGRHLSEDEVLTQRRGLGAGLGAVDRMMDYLDVGNNKNGGARIVAKKWLIKESGPGHQDRS